MVIVLDGFVFLGALVFEDLKLVLEDFDPLFELSEVLGGVLDEVNILVSGRLDLLVESFEVLELVLSFLLLFGQVQYEKLLDLKFLLGLSDLGVGD